MEGRSSSATPARSLRSCWSSGKLEGLESGVLVPSLMNLSGMGSTLFNKMAFWASMVTSPGNPVGIHLPVVLLPGISRPSPWWDDNPPAMPATPQHKPGKLEATEMGCARLTGTLGTWQCGGIASRQAVCDATCIISRFPPGSHIQNRGGVTQPSHPAFEARGLRTRCEGAPKGFAPPRQNTNSRDHQAPGDLRWPLGRSYVFWKSVL